MLSNKTISLVIPCRDEEQGITLLVKKALNYVDEVVVIDNGSSDNTVKNASKAGAIVFKEKRVDQHNIGYGYAHQLGMKKATGDYIVTMDGDATYPLRDIKKAILFLEKNSLDFVSCSRFPLKDQSVISSLRQLGVWILNIEVMVLFNYPMQDILSGMWVMNQEAKNNIFIKEGGWNLSPEIKLKALKNPKIKFSEYHIDHFPRVGESKQDIWVTGFDHLLYIFQFRVNDLFRNNWFKSFSKFATTFVGVILSLK